MVNVALTFAIICAAVVLCSANCKKNILAKKLSSAERSAILKTHNKVRLDIAKGKVPGQPRGINLKRLKWDSRLAKAAQKIANTCKFKHVAVKDDRWYVGQNLYEMSSTANVKGFNGTKAVYSWFNEHKIYTFPKYVSKAGHYTQVVWANTKYIGCGYVHYKTQGIFKYHKFLVCNYGPGGNLQGQAPYKTGAKTNKKCKNLC